MQQTDSYKYLDNPMGLLDTPFKEVLAHYPIPFEAREDQIETINLLSRWYRSGCFYPVGGGKTFIASYVGFYFGLMDLIDQIIILCPPILVRQWVKWIELFEGVSVCRYQGTPAKRKKLSLDADVIVTTPGLFMNDLRRFFDVFENRRVYVAVDEAVVVRNVETLAHKAVRDFCDTPDKYLMLLTGTEISKPFQAYGYIKLITPDVYRDYRQFALIHIRATDDYNVPCDYSNLDTVKRNLVLQAVRREADDIMDLPGVNFVTVEYDLEPKHYKLYKKVVDSKLVELEDGRILKGLLPSQMRNTCQRVILTPLLFEGVNIKPIAYTFIDDMLAELGQEKLIVFAKFQESNEAIYEYCQKMKGVGEPALIYGGKLRSAAKNKADLERFKNDPECRVLIGNPKSCGVGVDGLQHVCRAMLFLEIPPFDEFEQATGRIARSGQEHKCIIKLAVAHKTIQVSMRRNALNREAQAKEVVPTKALLRAALYGE